jgi:hypothetical protein
VCPASWPYILGFAANVRVPAELLRENKRMLDKAIRELDRERMALQTQEKKLINEIKKTAKEGQMVSSVIGTTGTDVNCSDARACHHRTQSR